jgi:glycosyltransferase 2 family protein
MASRERLLRLAATAERLATARRVRLVAQLLLVAALVFVLVRLRSIWHHSHVQLGQVDWLALAGAFLVSTVGVAAGGYIWLAILRRLGVETRPRWVGVFFQAQLSKYIPGAVWQYAGRATLGPAHGIPARAVAASIPVELGASVLAAAAAAPLLLGWWGVPVVLGLGVGVAAAGPRFARGSSKVATVTRAGTSAFALYLFSAPAVGVGFWLCARGLVATPAHDLPVYVGAYVVAWLIGFVAVYAPGGLGVREAVLVALLAGRLGASDALVVAAVSRAILTLVDLVLASVGVVLLGRSRGQPVLGGPVGADGDPPARRSG